MISFYRVGNRLLFEIVQWGIGGSVLVEAWVSLSSLPFFCPFAPCLSLPPTLPYGDCQLLLSWLLWQPPPETCNVISMLRALIQGLRTKVLKSLSLVKGSSNRTNLFLFLECGEGPSATKPCSKRIAGKPYFEFCSLLLFVNLVKLIFPLYRGLVREYTCWFQGTNKCVSRACAWRQHKLLCFIVSSLGVF